MKKEWKVFQAEVKEFDDKEMTITHFISTEKKDRGGDIMRADGMKIRGRPVVLMAHGHSGMGSEPIAKPIKIWKDTFKGNKGIAAKTKFYDGSHLTPPDNTGQRLYEKAKSGFMPNWSIGYLVIRKEDIRDGQDYGRDVLEWELLEYSPVGVPMNPDAQATEKGAEMAWFKFAENSEILPVEYKSLEVLEEEEKEKKYGEPCQYKEGVLVDMEGKPYPNEHACRLEDPGKYIRIRRQNNKFGQGIHAIWGIQAGGKPIELQAIRFSKEKFTAVQARAWLKEHKYTCKMFEPASEKCQCHDKPMVIVWDQDVSGDKCGLTCEADFKYVCEEEYKRGLAFCDGSHDATVYREKEDKFWCIVCDKEVDIKGVIPYRRTPLAPEKEAWAAGAEVKKADVKAMKIMCVWFDSNKADIKQSYKGPHHKAEGEHACVWNGVRALAAVCMGARGGMDIPEGDANGVRRHCEGHYRDFEKGEPPWKKKKGMEFLEILDSLKEEEKHQKALELIPDVADFFAPESKETKDLDARFEKFRSDFEETISPLVKSVGDLVQALAALPIAEKGKGQENKNASVGERIVVFAPEEAKRETVIAIDPVELGKTIGDAVKTSLQESFKKLTGKVD